MTTQLALPVSQQYIQDPLGWTSTENILAVIQVPHWHVWQPQRTSKTEKIPLAWSRRVFAMWCMINFHFIRFSWDQIRHHRRPTSQLPFHVLISWPSSSTRKTGATQSVGRNRHSKVDPRPTLPKAQQRQVLLLQRDHNCSKGGVRQRYCYRRLIFLREGGFESIISVSEHNRKGVFHCVVSGMHT